MGLEAEIRDTASVRLIAAGRRLLAQGDARFSLSRLCAEAGVTLEDFRASFASKAVLLQRLMEPPRPEPAAPDAWLERRLRVFERALGAMEEKSEKRERDYRLTLSRLEERLASLDGTQLKLDVAAAGRALEAVPSSPGPERERALQPQAVPAIAPEAPDAEDPAPGPLALAPLEPPEPGKADAEFLEAGRRAALAHARLLEQAPKRAPVSGRTILMSVLAAGALLLCAMVTLGHPGVTGAQAATQGTAHRLTAMTPLRKLTARADSGDAVAERELAFAYLRGQGVAKDLAAAARWSEAAAEQGDAQAQYLAGSLYRDGAGVPRDAAKAVALFAQAASGGQLKAMHNLAIAYLRGEGTAQDDAAAVAWFAKAAAGGYVDSAFDLAVLYEKGQGVAQDPRQALRWYRAAAAAGDVQAAARAKLLAQQVNL